MKNFIAFDFSQIETIDEFYLKFKEKLNLPDFFGNNLDAVFDVLTADAKMPLEIEFANLNLNQLEEFEDLLQTMENVEEEQEHFDFSYFLEIYEDDDEVDEIENEFEVEIEESEDDEIADEEE